MTNAKIPALLLAALFLSACGMQRAVGVVPRTFEDLEARSAAARGQAPADVSRETR